MGAQTQNYRAVISSTIIVLTHKDQRAKRSIFKEARERQVLMRRVRTHIYTK